MAEISAKVLIVGGGPGGYVCAIRAGQLGLDVVLVEQDGPEGGLGGTCLNVGCIPSKALIHAADAYERATEQAKSAPFGLRVERPTLDFVRTIEWKDGIVGRLTGGVAALLKRHKVKILRGRAELLESGCQIRSCEVVTIPAESHLDSDWNPHRTGNTRNQLAGRVVFTGDSRAAALAVHFGHGASHVDVDARVAAVFQPDGGRREDVRLAAENLNRQRPVSVARRDQL